MRLWLILDTSYLVYRAQYAMKDDANALYGFFATLMSVRDRFDTDHFVFCFDRGPLKRNELLPTYKERPHNDEEQHKKAKSVIISLGRNILPKMGFKNIIHQPGYEADDLIASITKHSLRDDEAVIVSTDNDLFQLLSPQVVMYNPNKQSILNEKVFREKWFDMSPDDWPIVKAIAGCRTDNIEGVKGVGEKTAAKFVQNQLKRGTVAYDKVTTASKEDIERRLRLVKLPFEGCKRFKLQTDENINWRRVRSYVPQEV